MLGLIILNIYSIFKTIYESFFKTGDFGKGNIFVGFDNYVKLFHDAEVWQALINTFKYAIVEVPFSIAIALMLAAGVLIHMEKSALAVMPGLASVIFNYVILAAFIPLIAVALYIFPTVAAFENKITTLITNAFYFAVKHIGYAIAVAVITILPMTMTLVDAKLFPVYMLIWLIVGFSLTAYADSWFMWKLFRPYFAQDDGEEFVKDTEPDQYVF